MRASKSVVPPAAVGTMILMTREGYVSAKVAVCPSASAIDNTRTRRRICFAPLKFYPARLLNLGRVVLSPREGARCSGDNLAALRRDAQHGEAALIGAIGAEAEDAVDAGETGRIGQRLVRDG